MALDEVGRGPWAGPVVAGAVVVPVGCEEALFGGARDSKLLSPLVRTKIDQQLRQVLTIGIGVASMREIDRLNIRRATALAMQRAIGNVGGADWLLVDGLWVPELGAAQTAVVQGDRHCLSIAAASVIAKVWRDQFMERLAQRYPGYGWQTNRGYGTAHHQQALQNLGITPCHRYSYAPVRRISQNGVQ